MVDVRRYDVAIAVGAKRRCNRCEGSEIEVVDLACDGLREFQYVLL